MSKNSLALGVNNISKQYCFGGSQEQYHTLCDAIVNSLKAPFHCIFCKIYEHPSVNEFWVRKDVSFGVEQGEVVGIIGRNVAGKSIPD